MSVEVLMDNLVSEADALADKYIAEGLTPAEIVAVFESVKMKKGEE